MVKLVDGVVNIKSNFGKNSNKNLCEVVNALFYSISLSQTNELNDIFQLKTLSKLIKVYT